MGISRRALVLGASAVAGASALGALGLSSAAVRRQIGWTGPDGQVPAVPPADVLRGNFTSTARGRSVQVAVVGDRSAPSCLVLHGRGGSAVSILALGLPEFLAASGLRLSLVAVDGGDEYWTGPSMRMLTDELPGWLDTMEVARPRAALGISMGGFGALALAARTPLDVVAAISPALFPDWEAAEDIHGFPDERTWEEHEPLRHKAEVTAEVGIWCGREDPFHDAAVSYGAATGSFDHGAHDEGYWRRVLPEALRFIG
ncbi:MAG: alpha/beta hydrolase-fold protein [Umezawaea sp.]